jgi:NDP-sugar pyrophosphorylase family protein
MNNLKVVLLSAGYGTRLGALTKDKPKALIDLNGKPLIEHTLTRLAQHGLTDVIVNIHYLPQLLPAYLHERVLYYYEPRLLGHVKTLLSLRHWLRDADFMVINADTITDVDYTEMQDFHQRAKALKGPIITTCMDEYRATGTWIYSQEFFNHVGLPVMPYRPVGLFWQDAGTPERLAKLKARLAEEDHA